LWGNAKPSDAAALPGGGVILVHGGKNRWKYQNFDIVIVGTCKCCATIELVHKLRRKMNRKTNDQHPTTGSLHTN